MWHLDLPHYAQTLNCPDRDGDFPLQENYWLSRDNPSGLWPPAIGRPLSGPSTSGKCDFGMIDDKSPSHHLQGSAPTFAAVNGLRPR